MPNFTKDRDNAILWARNILDEDFLVIDLDSMCRPRWPGSLRRGVRTDRRRFLENWQTGWQRGGFSSLMAEYTREPIP